jgi:hypothetical protein
MAGAYIVGDKTNSYVVFDSNSGVVYTFDVKAGLFGQPRPIAPALVRPKAVASQSTPSAPAQAAAPKSTASALAQTAASQPTPSAPAQTADATNGVGITGNATSGVVLFSGTLVSYLTDINNRQASWKPLPEAPCQIRGICGDLQNGIVIHDGDNIYQIKDVFNNPVWQEATSPRIPIAGIAGDATNGFVVYRTSPWDDKDDHYDRGDNKFVPSVYMFAAQQYGSFTSPSEPRIVIEAMMGDGKNGYVAMGENQLFSLDNKGEWTRLNSLNFGLACATGNPKDGVVALVGAESYVVNSTDYKTWTLLQTLLDSGSSANAGDKPANDAKTSPGSTQTPDTSVSASTAPVSVSTPPSHLTAQAQTA